MPGTNANISEISLKPCSSIRRASTAAILMGTSCTVAALRVAVTTTSSRTLESWAKIGLTKAGLITAALAIGNVIALAIA